MKQNQVALVREGSKDGKQAGKNGMFWLNLALVFHAIAEADSLQQNLVCLRRGNGQLGGSKLTESTDQLPYASYDERRATNDRSNARIR